MKANDLKTNIQNLLSKSNLSWQKKCNLLFSLYVLEYSKAPKEEKYVPQFGLLDDCSIKEVFKS